MTGRYIYVARGAPSTDASAECVWWWRVVVAVAAAAVGVVAAVDAPAAPFAPTHSVAA